MQSTEAVPSLLLLETPDVSSGHVPACLGNLLHHAGAWARAPAFEVSGF